MKEKYKVICTLKENSQEYRISRNLDNRRFYKEIDGNYVKLSLEEGNFYKGIEKISDKIGHDTKVKVRKEKIRKASKVTYEAALLLTIASLLGSTVHSLYLENAPKREYIHSEKYEDDIMNLFTKSMDLNSTINKSCSKEIKKYLEVFVKECERLDLMNDDVYIKIAKQLRLKNFYDIEVLSYDDLCEIFNFRNGEYIAAQLSNYVDGSSFSHEYTSIANLLYFNENGKRALLSGEDIIVVINGENFRLDLKKINKNDDKVFKLIDTYVNQSLVINDVDSNAVYANIFSPIIESYNFDSEISMYYELQEDGTIQNVSYREYYKMLANMIYTEGEEFDCNNKIDRELLYLYIEALRVNFGVQWEEEPTEYILKSILAPDNFLPVISSGDLLRYLKGNDLDIKSLVNFWDICLMGEEAINYLQELNRCLKVEVALGNLSQEDYEEFVEMVIGSIELLYPDKLEEFKEANLYNKSMEGFSLKLIPYHEL